jgi:hypothetical protein
MDISSMQPGDRRLEPLVLTFFAMSTRNEFMRREQLMHRLYTAHAREERKPLLAENKSGGACLAANAPPEIVLGKRITP